MGGLTHLWGKIKSYYDTYLVTWKTSNFGTGTYKNKGEFELFATTSYLKISTNAHIELKPSSIVELLDSSNIELDDGQILLKGYSKLLDYKISCRMGIAIIDPENTTGLRVINACGVAIKVTVIKGTSASAHSVNTYTVEALGTVPNAAFRVDYPSLMFWAWASD